MSITRELSEGREITRGTFDPRTYKEDDPVNWARKRKPEWMGTTGKIIFTRERTVDREPSPEQSAPPPAEPTEVVKQPPKVVPIKTDMEMKQIDPYWPRKRRSDITRSRVV